jgi:predicted NBD/HSP70 family sugar kinase
MAGWDGHPISDDLGARLGAPTIVDNDVNIAAVAEASQPYAGLPLLVLKVDAGIGVGIVMADRTVQHGADGAAGDVGHIRVGDIDELCTCGNTGCLEAVASLTAVLRQLGISHATADEYTLGIDILRARLVAGDADAMRAIRKASERIGQVAASMVQLLNPRTLVLSGAFSIRHDELLSGVRAEVYQRSVPLATRELTLTTSQLGENAGVLGGIELGMQEILRPAGVRRVIAELRAERQPS